MATYFKCACQHCGGHIEFPSEAAGQKITCPHCSWETELLSHSTPTLGRRGGTPPRNKIHVLLALGAGMVAGLAIGAHFMLQKPPLARAAKSLPPRAGNAMTTAGVSNLPAPPVAKPDPWHGLNVGPISLESGNGHLVYATGILRNTTSRERFGVKVELDVYDAKSNKLDSATDYIPVIEPGKEWKFRALVMDDKASRAKLSSIKEQ